MAAAPTQPRRLWRWLALGLVVLVGLPLAGLAVFLATLDLEAYKPRIIAAAEQATGRRLELNGPIGLGFSLVPTLELRDVAFANMAGGSRPHMLTVQQAEIELALLPLLSRRVELRRLVLVKPDILLETDSSGRPNWQFRPTAAAAPAAPQPAPPGGAAGPGLSFGIGRVVITDGQLVYRNGRKGSSQALVVRSLNLTSQDGSGPLHLAGDLSLNGHGFTLAMEAGSLASLAAPGATPFPLNLVLEAEGARFGLNGSVAQPQQGKGWRFELTARVPELARFAAWVPDVPLPALRDIQLSLGAADVGAALPELRDLRLSIGASDLAAMVPELRLASVNLTLARPDQPLTLAVEALLRGAPLRASGTLGAPALLLPPGTPGAIGGAYPIDLSLAAGSASATLKGSIAQPAALTGVDLGIGLRVPDLAALAPLAGGATLPPLKDLALDFRLAERSAAFASGAHLRGLRLASSALDANGELTVVVGQRTGLAGRLASTRVNLDALRPPAPPASAAPTAAATTPPAAPARADGRVIPDTPLPLEALRLLEADLRWTIGEMLAQGVTYKDVVLVLAAQDGRARLEELSLTTPGGRVQVRAAADATLDPPAVQLALRGDQLDLPALLNSQGLPNQATSGKLDLDVDVRGRGRTLRQVAAGLDGRAGLAVTSLQSRGSNPETLLGRTLQQLQQAVPSAGNQIGQGIGVACAAFRFDVEAGIAQSRALLVDSTLGKVGGGGQASLRDEQLNLRLDLDLAVPVPGINLLRVRAPMPVTGSFAAPRLDYGAVRAGAAGSTVAGAAGQLLGGAGGGNALGGLLGGVTGSSGGAELPDCASQLLLARNGRQGPVPASLAPVRQAAPATTTTPAPTLPNLGSGLRGLFGR